METLHDTEKHRAIRRSLRLFAMLTATPFCSTLALAQSPNQTPGAGNIDGIRQDGEQVFIAGWA
jgi:hypothetical protein